MCPLCYVEEGILYAGDFRMDLTLKTMFSTCLHTCVHI